MKPPRNFLLALCALAITAWAKQSLACPVCFGESDDPIIGGLQAWVLFMVGVTYFLILSGVAAFILLRSRARRLAETSSAHDRTAHDRISGRGAGSNAELRGVFQP